MKYLNKFIPAVFMLLAVYSCEQPKPADNKPAVPAEQAKPANKLTPDIPYTVVKKHPHDVTAFTEGFLFHDSELFESTGASEFVPQSYSAFGTVDLQTGKLTKKAELDGKLYFGEGIVFLNNKICQLTYTNQIGFIYDAKTFERLGQFGYQNKQGWGLTTEGKSLIMSDGTNHLTYLDPNDFHSTKVLDVSENGYALDYLNELEYIKGYIYANVWMKNLIVKIDPATGEVVGKLDLDALFNESKSSYANSLETNGIAYDAITDKILVTGKMWPTIYEIRFEH